MIFCNIKGGLGNQMFQYAFAKSLKHNSIFFDLSFLNKYNKSTHNFAARTFELDIFKNIQTRTINTLVLKFLMCKNPKYKIIKVLLPSKLKDLDFVDDDNAQIYKNSGKSIYVNGYFQVPTLFDHIRNKLLIDFQFPKLPIELKQLENSITSQNAVSIHVRRGDYLNEETMNFHGNLIISYYELAISQIKTKVVDPHFFIFSDDITWCVAHFSSIVAEKTFVSGHQNKDWTDMYLMSLCKHHIIANSTFSWWGAWLGTHPEKLVIAPKSWFKNTSSKIIPEKWITI